MFRSINFVLLFGMIMLSVGVHADYSAPASELMLVPQFCWGQYNSSQFKGPQFHIHDCGPGMNHYCGALLGYNRAMKMASRGAKESELRAVLDGVEYTLRWMKKWPACPIRSHVENTYNKVRIDLGLPPVVNQNQPASIQAPAAPVIEDNAAKASMPKAESGSDSGGKQESSSHIEEATQPPGDKETKPVEPEKIGSPTNPWCRFCPDPVDKQ
jgi:hypothetical protein